MTLPRGDRTLGFVGLGVMGRPMARNLLAAGYAVVAHNRSRGPVDEVVQAGATAAGSPREVAARSDVVITMLPDSPDVAAVVAGPDGVLEGARAGQLLIDMSTIAPAVSARLAARAADLDAEMLDAPVSGGDVGAAEGTLSIMVGGSEAAFERARPIFDVLGRTVVHVGGAGAGQVVKACNQIVVALTIAAVSEALVLGSKAGVAPEAILGVLSGGLAGNRVIEVRRRNFLEHDFTPGFKSELHRKDLGIALAAAHEHAVSLPVTAIVAQLFEALRSRGRGASDHTVLLTLLEEMAQHTIGTAAV